MKLDYCAVHSGALIAPGGEPNCLFIRHDDGRIMSQREIWAEIERLREIAGEGYPGIAHDMEKLRAELERNRGDLIIEADRANRAEAERDALLALLPRIREGVGRWRGKRAPLSIPVRASDADILLADIDDALAAKEKE